MLTALAEAELDDAEDLVEEDVPTLNPVISQRGSVQLSTIQEPVIVRGWPMGLALASAPSITVSLTATGFQKMILLMASLNLPSRRGGYKVETNQYTQGLASIRAQPKVGHTISYEASSTILHFHMKTHKLCYGYAWCPHYPRVLEQLKLKSLDMLQATF